MRKNRDDLEQFDLEALFNEYYQDMLAVAYKYLRNLPDAEDAVSRAFISLANNPGVLGGLDEDQIRPRLMALTKFRAFDHYRGESAHGHSDMAAAENRAATSGSIESAELAILMDQMTEPEKTIFSLRYVHDLKVPEISALLGISNATVRKYLKNGRAWLRSALTGEDEDV